MATLTRWQPFAELAQLDDRLHELFGRLEHPGITMAAIDVIREDDQMVIKADMPGLSPDEVKIQVENGILTVSGEHQESSESKDERFMRRERSYGSFTRSVTLPEGVDPEAIEATSKDGVVQVTVPLPEKGKKVIEITPKAES